MTWDDLIHSLDRSASRMSTPQLIAFAAQVAQLAADEVGASHPHARRADVTAWLATTMETYGRLPYAAEGRVGNACFAAIDAAAEAARRAGATDTTEARTAMAARLVACLPEEVRR